MSGVRLSEQTAADIPSGTLSFPRPPSDYQKDLCGSASKTQDWLL